MKKIEDIYGAIEIPDNVMWGVNTQRSLENFSIGYEKMPEVFIESMLHLKKAAAQANKIRFTLEEEKADAIIEACNLILNQDFMPYFPLSIWQTGSGTQTNMNVNEVVANIANQIAPSLKIHPNDDVNCGQSSNDVFPTSMHICSTLMLKRELLPALLKMEKTLLKLSEETKSIVKIGRPHLQDATPITFGQEVSGWSYMFTEGIKQLTAILPYFQTLSIGATAIGTGVNTYEQFSDDICHILNENLQETFIPSENLFHAISTKDAFVFGHGALNAIAANALKMANDIRWLASGPRCGLGEITLPVNEAGSSIMPGKVNPTQCEALTMVCVQVMANNSAIVIGSSQGNFQLNTFMPLIMHNTWQSIQLLSDALNSFHDRCLYGLKVNQRKMNHNLTTSLMTATYLNKKLGYDKTSEIVNEAYHTESNIKDIILKHNIMSSESFDDFFKYEEMIRPNKL